MKIFISYSREDEAVAHLLAHILRKNKIDCLIDRELRAGEKFDSKLQQMIKEADLVLVLLTKDSSQSAWVNQEIGFAIAHGKTVWPLVIETDIEPHGMLSTTQAYSMFDWSNPSAIERLVEALRTPVSGMEAVRIQPYHTGEDRENEVLGGSPHGASEGQVEAASRSPSSGLLNFRSVG